MGESNKKKVAIAGIASILLVAAVVAVAVGATRKNAGTGEAVSTSNKAVDAVCSPTDYKETCQKSLAKANTTDPRQLIEVAFNAAIDDIAGVVKQSALFQEAVKDKSNKDALAVCDEVLGTAVDDLKRSVDKISELDATKVTAFVDDLKIWLSAVITNQETCIGAFENTTGDTGEKMKNLLKSSKQMSSNALAMVTDITSLLTSFNFGSNRKLLSDDWTRRSLVEVDISRPNAVVALDGSGQFKTINEAIATVPKKNLNKFVIYIKAGVYIEQVVIPKGYHNIVLVGDGPLQTIITGNLNSAAGVKTFQSATLAVNADDFFARSLRIDNTAGPVGHQAVAVRVSGDRAVFFDCHINGYQDTLYTHTYRQFYKDCLISGTIDFVFGDSLAIFQNCDFVIRGPMENQACMVTAQGRDDRRSEGAIVIMNSRILPDPSFFVSPTPIVAYLGRPWKEYSRTIIMSTFIDGIISPDGWSPWMGNFALDTLFYAEYMNFGPGSNEARRVNWKGIQHINPAIANSWTPGMVFGGDLWIRDTRIPYAPNLM